VLCFRFKEVGSLAGPPHQNCRVCPVRGFWGNVESLWMEWCAGGKRRVASSPSLLFIERGRPYSIDVQQGVFGLCGGIRGVRNGGGVALP